MVVEQGFEVSREILPVEVDYGHTPRSLSTLIREYAALMALKAYDVLDSVLHSRLARPPTVDQAEVQKVMSAYKVNEPQANAILKSLGTEGFALIQG